MSTSFFYAVIDWVSYLHHPPPSSWIARTASTFRILALLLILPCIFLTALDVASYLIVRTLGTESAVHPLDSMPATTGFAPDSKLDAPPPSGPLMDHHEFRNPPTVVISPQFDSSGTGETHTEETYFTTPSDANFALAGEGIFSPPGSRSASPPIMRSPRAAHFGASTESKDFAGMRKRV